MLSFDHLSVIAPSLAEGVDHVRDCLGMDIPLGGTHPEMGTHNHVLRLGEEIYMEVIAVDPGAAPPQGPRWFGLDDPETVRSDWENGLRLRGWVARSDDIDALLADHAGLFCGKTRVSRDGEHCEFSLRPDGGLPLGGLLPSVIDRGGRNPDTARMEDQGAGLHDFVLEHPSPAEITALYEMLRIRNAPRVQEGPSVRYTATIETSAWIRRATAPWSTKCS